MDTPDAARKAAFDALNAAFDRIFVITLERAKERQARVTKDLDGLKFQFHPGADKNQLDFAALERDGVLSQAAAQRNSRVGKALKPGEVGCALSHRQIWEETVRQGWKRVLVFEDDACTVPEALPELGEALTELPPDFDLAYLGWTNFETVTMRERIKQGIYLLLSALRLMKWTPGQVLRFHPRPYSKHLRRAGLHHCTHAYALSTAGARKLLEAQTPVAHASDQVMIWMILRARLEAFICVPKFFAQDRRPQADGLTSFRRE
jgi:glycosyl transferase family 25